MSYLCGRYFHKMLLFSFKHDIVHVIIDASLFSAIFTRVGIFI